MYTYILGYANFRKWSAQHSKCSKVIIEYFYQIKIVLKLFYNGGYKIENFKPPL